MTLVRALGNRRGEWEGKEKNIKEGEQRVRFEDEPRPSASGTESRCLTGFLRRGQTLSGSPFSGSCIFPPVGLKDFSPMIVTLKIRSYRLLYLDSRPLPLHAPHAPTFCNSCAACKDVSVHYGLFLLFPLRVLAIGTPNELVE